MQVLPAEGAPGVDLPAKATLGGLMKHQAVCDGVCVIPAAIEPTRLVLPNFKTVRFPITQSSEQFVCYVRSALRDTRPSRIASGDTPASSTVDGDRQMVDEKSAASDSSEESDIVMVDKAIEEPDCLDVSTQAESLARDPSTDTCGIMFLGYLVANDGRLRVEHRPDVLLAAQHAVRDSLVADCHLHRPASASELSPCGYWLVRCQGKAKGRQMRYPFHDGLAGIRYDVLNVYAQIACKHVVLEYCAAARLTITQAELKRCVDRVSRIVFERLLGDQVTQMLTYPLISLPDDAKAIESGNVRFITPAMLDEVMDRRERGTGSAVVVPVSQIAASDACTVESYEIFERAVLLLIAKGAQSIRYYLGHDRGVWIGNVFISVDGIRVGDDVLMAILATRTSPLYWDEPLIDVHGRNRSLPSQAGVRTDEIPARPGSNGRYLRFSFDVLTARLRRLLARVESIKVSAVPDQLRVVEEVVSKGWPFSMDGIPDTIQYAIRVAWEANASVEERPFLFYVLRLASNSRVRDTEEDQLAPPSPLDIARLHSLASRHAFPTPYAISSLACSRKSMLWTHEHSLDHLDMDTDIGFIDKEIRAAAGGQREVDCVTNLVFSDRALYVLPTAEDLKLIIDIQSMLASAVATRCVCENPLTMSYTFTHPFTGVVTVIKHVAHFNVLSVDGPWNPRCCGIYVELRALLAEAAIDCFYALVADRVFQAVFRLLFGTVCRFDYAEHIAHVSLFVRNRVIAHIPQLVNDLMNLPLKVTLDARPMMCDRGSNACSENKKAGEYAPIYKWLLLETKKTVFKLP